MRESACLLLQHYKEQIQTWQHVESLCMQCVPQASINQIILGGNKGNNVLDLESPLNYNRRWIT